MSGASAREKLAELLYWSIPSATDDGAHRKAAAEIDAFRDEVAHELADKLEDAALSVYGEGSGFDVTKAYHLRDAADLIRPGAAN